MGKSTPKAPDPVKVSAAQTESNKDTASYNAALNRIDQSSPFGSISYTTNGTDPATGAPLYAQNTQLSPQLQGLFDSQVGSQQGISDAITGAIGRLPNGAFDPSGINTDKIRDASYQHQVGQLQPEFDRAKTTLTGTLNDRGLPIGSEIWNNEQNRYDTNVNNSLTQASRQADLDASNEYQRQFGNALTEYNLPQQQLAALMGNSQAVGTPQFSGVPQAASANTDTAGNTWNAYNADLQNSQNANANLWSGLLGIGKLGVSAFSDVRLKRDIKRVGAMPSGLPTYRFKYLWSDEEHEGVMAQEALHYAPEAVSMDATGFFKVDYSKLH